METTHYARLHDYHMHTRLCGHAVGELNEYVERAIALGLPEIGFSDHMPMTVWGAERDPTLSMTEADMATYVAWVEEARARYAGKITIRFGVEADYTKGRHRELRDYFDAYPFDYVIGSVHFIEGWSFDHPDHVEMWETRDVDEVYRAYFDLVVEAARSGMFQMLAHLDLVKKFGHRPSAALDMAGLGEGVADAVAASGAATEINTAGWYKPVGEQYPAGEFVRACVARGVPILLSSDAHDPGHVGRDFDRALVLATSLGATRAPVFEKRAVIGYRTYA